MTTTLDRVGSGTAPAAPAPDALPCFSCGREASVRKWYATPTTKPEMCCGRCALATMGDTVGTIAALLFDLGAGRSFESNASISQVKS